MNRFLQNILTIIVAFSLTASVAVAGKPCHNSCCEQEDAKQYALACSGGSAVSAPAMACCGMVKEASERQATLNTGSILPNLDLASLAEETPVRFIGATTRTTTKHASGTYESPPIFILDATFIC